MLVSEEQPHRLGMSDVWHYSRKENKKIRRARLLSVSQKFVEVRPATLAWEAGIAGS